MPHLPDDDDVAGFEKTRYLRRGMKNSGRKGFGLRCKFGGKHTYPNRQRALYIASRSMKWHPEVKLRVYSCPNCHLWHLTKRPQPNQK